MVLIYEVKIHKGRGGEERRGGEQELLLSSSPRVKIPGSVCFELTLPLTPLPFKRLRKISAIDTFAKKVVNFAKLTTKH